jgi:hypothetical protein
MAPSGIARVLEIFFGGNADVEAAVLFDSTGETVDYHTHIQPFDARLLAAYSGIIFSMTKYKLLWLEDAKITMIEICTERIDIVIVPVLDELCLVVSIAPGGVNENFIDTVAGSVEALCQEIG